MLKDLGNKKPFREIEIEVPDELLENILLIPVKLGPCPHAPIIKVERKLSFEQTKEMMAYEDKIHRAACQTLGVNTISEIEIPTFRDSLVRKDLSVLSEIMATTFYSKIRRQIRFWLEISNWSNLYQMVEIDWLFCDLCPRDRGIHYEIITKREIRIKGEGD
jgi:hypothetical protein